MKGQGKAAGKGKERNGKVNERQWKVSERQCEGQRKAVGKVKWEGQGKVVERSTKGSGNAKEGQQKVKKSQQEVKERQWEQGKAANGQGNPAERSTKCSRKGQGTAVENVKEGQRKRASYLAPGACRSRGRPFPPPRSTHRREFCHFADTPSPSVLKHLLNGKGVVQQNDRSLADG